MVFRLLDAAAPRLEEFVVAEYFFEVRHDLLHEPETGMMAIVNEIEGNIISSLCTQPVQPETGIAGDSL